MNTVLRLMSVASLLMLSVTGCNANNTITAKEGEPVQNNVATLSDDKLTEEEVKAVKEGTDLPGGFGNAVIYDSNKMLLTYPGTSSCPEHPESATVEGNNLKIIFSEPEPEKVCAAVMTGPFTKVINLPNGFIHKTDYKVTAIMGSREIDIPVVVN